MIYRAKESSGKNSGFMLETSNLPSQKEFLGSPKSERAGGEQVDCILKAIAHLKNKGITRDHVVFSFVSRWVQPLQHQKHPAFRYEGTQDPTRMSPEPMAQSEVVKRCCKVLDNFDKSLKLPTLFWANNPPENAWVCGLKTMSSTCS